MTPTGNQTQSSQTACWLGMWVLLLLLSVFQFSHFYFIVLSNGRFLNFLCRHFLMYTLFLPDLTDKIQNWNHDHKKLKRRSSLGPLACPHFITVWKPFTFWWELNRQRQNWIFVFFAIMRVMLAFYCPRTATNRFFEQININIKHGQKVFN